MIKVDAVLRRILEAAAEEVTARQRGARYRRLLEDEARARHAAEGAAPTWKARGLGQVRWDGADADPKPYVAAPVAFGSWAAQRHPSGVVATLTVPADRLAAAVEALGFAGIPDITAQVTAHPRFVETFLEQVDVAGSEEAGWVVVAADTGEVVEGLAARTPSPRLVVVLDRQAKADALALADTTVDDETAEADAPPDEEEPTQGAPA